jgi:hypothetical protein
VSAFDPEWPAALGRRALIVEGGSLELAFEADGRLIDYVLASERAMPFLAGVVHEHAVVRRLRRPGAVGTSITAPAVVDAPQNPVPVAKDQRAIGVDIRLGRAAISNAPIAFQGLISQGLVS